MGFCSHAQSLATGQFHLASAPGHLPVFCPAQVSGCCPRAFRWSSSPRSFITSSVLFGLCGERHARFRELRGPTRRRAGADGRSCRVRCPGWRRSPTTRAKLSRTLPCRRRSPRTTNMFVCNCRASPPRRSLRLTATCQRSNRGTGRESRARHVRPARHSSRRIGPGGVGQIRADSGRAPV